MYEINTNIILVFYKMRFYLCNMFTLTKIAIERRAAKANCLRGGGIYIPHLHRRFR